MSIRLKQVLLFCFVISLSFKLASFRFLVSIPSRECFSGGRFGDAQIFLMKSATIDNRLQHHINVYWHNVAFQHGDTIAIFNGKPTDDAKPLWQFEPTTDRGFIQSTLNIPLLHHYHLTSYKTEILVYCGAWLQDGKIKKVNCLSTQPTWMHDRKAIFSNQKLSHMIIPGTYMSPLYIKNLPSRENVTETITVSQNQDFLSQLVHGARYLDVPVGHFPDRNHKYWAVDKKRKVIPLNSIIQDIRFFLNGTKEIVILAIRDFSVGFESTTDHQDFVHYLKKKFSDHLLMQQNLDNQWSITLGEIWALNKRLIIIYHNSYQNANNYLWGSPWTINLINSFDIESFRVNVINSEKVMQLFFELGEKLNRQFLRIVNLVVSVDVDVNHIEASCNKTCLDNHPSNSRKLGDKVAPIITHLYNEQLYQYTNIVLSKFLASTGLVDIAILWNERKARDCITFFELWNEKYYGELRRKTLYFDDDNDNT